MTEAEREYADALAAYRTAMARLVESKKHVPETPRDRYRRLRREKRECLRLHPPQPDPMTMVLLQCGRRALDDWGIARLRSGIIAALADEQAQ